MSLKIEWRTEKRKIKDLKAYKTNPRRMTKDQAEQLKKSLEKFNYVELIACQPDNRIIAGHMRVQVLKQLGKASDEIEVRVPSRILTEDEMREYLIRSNVNTGEWDWDELHNSWDPSDLMEWGFDIEELMGGEIASDSSIEEDDEILSPVKDEDAFTKLGDIYELDGHRIMCGDSTNPESVSLLLKSSIPVLMVTDPPYGVEYDPSWRKSIKAKHGVACRATGKVENDDRVDWQKAWNLFPGNVCYIWHASIYTSDVHKSLISCNYQIICQIIWKKQHFALSRGDYHWQHEPCWYAVKEGAKHNWQGARDQSSVWEISNLNAFGKNQEDERTAHSTQKPLECMARPIKNNSMIGEEIYDPFLGSGTTLIAADQLDRICYGMELSPAYCDIIVKRWVNSRIKSGKDVKILKNGKLTKEFYG